MICMNGCDNMRMHWRHVEFLQQESPTLIKQHHAVGYVLTNLLVNRNALGLPKVFPSDKRSLKDIASNYFRSLVI